MQKQPHHGRPPGATETSKGEANCWRWKLFCLSSLFFFGITENARSGFLLVFWIFTTRVDLNKRNKHPLRCKIKTIRPFGQKSTRETRISVFGFWSEDLLVTSIRKVQRRPPACLLALQPPAQLQQLPQDPSIGDPGQSGHLSPFYRTHCCTYKKGLCICMPTCTLPRPVCVSTNFRPFLISSYGLILPPYVGTCLSTPLASSSIIFHLFACGYLLTTILHLFTRIVHICVCEGQNTYFWTICLRCVIHISQQ